MTLRQWRQQLGLSLWDVASKLDLTDGHNPAATVSKWERGLRTPRASMLSRIELMTAGRVTESDFRRHRVLVESEAA